MEAVLLVDAANVVGSRPDGWWRDRAGATSVLVGRIAAAVAAGALEAPVTVVVEGRARGGVVPGAGEGVEVVEAPGSGDDALVALAAGRPAGVPVVVVTADRELRRRLEGVGAGCVGPRWLLARLPG